MGRGSEELRSEAEELSRTGESTEKAGVWLPI